MTKVIQNSQTATFDLFRKEFAVMNVHQSEDGLVYNMQSNKIAVQAALRANKIIERDGLQLIAEAAKFPLNFLYIKPKSDPYLSAKNEINRLCNPKQSKSSNELINHNSYERLLEMVSAEHGGLCHA